MLRRECPCGWDTSYDACCGRLHRGAARAESPEELMRSRYTAYAVGDLDHVWRTWHPRTRPDDLVPDAGLTWTGLEVHEAGVVDDEHGWVSFTASYTLADGTAGRLRERSRFERRAGRWMYVDGDVS